MKILEITNNYQNKLKEVADVIKMGGLVVFPTDTVYALLVDPTNEKAVNKLLAFKDRWTGKAISIAVSNISMASEYVKLDNRIRNIYENLLPGPFTIVSQGKHSLAEGIEAENGTLGIRIPNSKLIIDLIKILDKPVTVTSANLSGRRPNYSIESFLKQLSVKKKGMLDMVVNVGKLVRNKPSTVIDVTKPELKTLRRGDLVLGLGKKVLISKSEKETEKIAEYLLKRSIPASQDSISSRKEKEKSLEQNKPLVFLLSGDLGCGKTVFSRKVGKLLGIKKRITSPTFLIYNEYLISPDPSNSLLSSFFDRTEVKQTRKFLHMDLYKITTKRDLEEINFLNLFEKNTISCIEWPENMGKEYMVELKKITKIVLVNFRYVDEKTREIEYLVL